MRLGVDVSNWQGIITGMRLAADGNKHPEDEFRAAAKWAGADQFIGPESIALILPGDYLEVGTTDISCFRENHWDTAIVRASLETTDKYLLAQKQMDTFIRGGFDLSVYGWVYWDWDPIETAREINTMLADRPVRWVWWDMEEEASVPGAAGIVNWIKAAIGECERLGLNAGIYTGAWWYNKYLRGNTDLAYRPLWDANYSQQPFSGLLRYGGWDPRMVFAHQFSSSWRICGRELDANGFSEAYYQFPIRGQLTPPVEPPAGQLDWPRLKPLMDAVYDSNHAAILQTAKTEDALTNLYDEARRQGMPF